MSPLRTLRTSTQVSEPEVQSLMDHDQLAHSNYISQVQDQDQLTESSPIFQVQEVSNTPHLQSQVGI